jgi:hypothetical protein
MKLILIFRIKTDINSSALHFGMEATTEVLWLLKTNGIFMTDCGSVTAKARAS